MHCWGVSLETSVVALLAEGVDRNNLMQGLMDGLPTSPSSRRAWIEMHCWGVSLETSVVALLAEGVDRNTLAFSFLLLIEGRPPRGGRG